MLRAILVTAGIFMAALSVAGAQTAGNYPSRPITLIIPYAAGGVTDIVARVITAKMGEMLGERFIVENRAGAGGAIGTAAAARATPDGYTLLLGNAGTHSTAPLIHRNAGYDPLKDFSVIAPLGAYTFVLICNPKVPANSLSELITLAKREPGKMTYGSAGMGSNVHFIFEYFKLRAGIDFTHVPYRGAGPMMNDIIAGRIDCTFDGTSKRLIDAGQVRAFAVASIKRDPLYPNLPTLDEAGLRGFNLPGWQSLMGPRGLPEAIIRKLNESANAATRDQAVIDRLKAIGFHAGGGTVEELRAFVESDSGTYRRIAKEAKMPLN
jgi:tripartite-type tricarboxylate transporter receptor subunit TctC